MKQVIILIITAKISIVLLIFLAYSLLPFGKVYYYSNFVYPPGEEISLKSAYKTWDAQHYLFLSEKGYKKGNFSDSFYPLFPNIIRFFASIFYDSFWVGIVFSNLFSTIACIYFYLFVKERFPKDGVAYTALIFLLAFPTAFYFSLIYTESLFFLLAICFFYYLYKNDYRLAAVLAFFLPWTRPMGLFIIIPFAFYYISHHRSLLHNQPFLDRKFTIDKNIVFLLSPVCGFLGYLLFMQLKTGNPFEGFSMQQYNIAHWSVGSIFSPLLFLQNFFSHNLTIHGFTNSVIDRIFFVIFLVSLPFIYRKTTKPLFLYSLFLGFTPFLGSFMSYTRYMLVIFPIFITAAIYIENKKYAELKYPLLFLSLIMQSLFLVMHSLNYWVA